MRTKKHFQRFGVSIPEEKLATEDLDVSEAHPFANQMDGGIRSADMYEEACEAITAADVD